MLAKFFRFRLWRVAIPQIGKTITLFQKLQKLNIRNFSFLFAVGLSLSLALSACTPNASNNSETTQTASPSPNSSATNSNTVVRIGIEKNPEGLKTVLDGVNKVSDWAKKNPPEVAKLLSSVLSIDAAVLETAEKRREYGVLPITEEVIANQQEIADTFYNIKLIPKEVKVKELVWQGSK